MKSLVQYINEKQEDDKTTNDLSWYKKYQEYIEKSAKSLMNALKKDGYGSAAKSWRT